MSRKVDPPSKPLPKVSTGIQGFDELSHGGLPRHRTSLLIGGPGAGKTVFALQCLANAVRRKEGTGIFVAFEESTDQIIANSVGFDWGLARLTEKQLFFLDAHLSPTLVTTGDFDLAGMLAILTAKKKEIGAKWIVFDGIDVLLTLLRDPVAEMREIYRLRDWLADNALTAIVTAKLENRTTEAMHYGFLQFMADCVVRLDQHLEDRVSTRTVQITKYRGSDYAGAAFPLSFGPSGIEVGAVEPVEIIRNASSERISIGVERLDSMLGGGVFRGGSTLISGVPGTSKTTLAGSFAEAACRRGERVLFVSYDEAAAEIIRNLSSSGIQLKTHCKSGLLRMYSARTEGIGAEEHLIRLMALIREHQPHCIVIDPLTAIAKAGNLSTARMVATRFVRLAKDRGITLLVTALSEGDDALAEVTNLQISTVADTWIHLSYLVRSGERNRALTIVKSRGTRHSNQVRELILSESGPTLADVYSAGGEVLMGTLRWEKEAEDKASKLRKREEIDYKHHELQSAEARINAEIKALQMELQRQRHELALHSRIDEGRSINSSEREKELHRRRDGDSQSTAVKKRRKKDAK